MAEQGPKPGSRGKDPSEAEKINNDDLLAILGGVVSPGYAAKKKEEEIIKEEATTPGSAPASTPSPVVPPVAAASAPPSPAPIPGKVAPKIEMDTPLPPRNPCRPPPTGGPARRGRRQRARPAYGLRDRGPDAGGPFAAFAAHPSPAAAARVSQTHGFPACQFDAAWDGEHADLA
jgi:hypothetical protein